MKVGVSYGNSGFGKSKLIRKHRIRTSNTFVAKLLMFLKIPFIWDIKVMEYEADR